MSIVDGTRRQWGSSELTVKLSTANAYDTLPRYISVNQISPKNYETTRLNDPFFKGKIKAFFLEVDASFPQVTKQEASRLYGILFVQNDQDRINYLAYLQSGGLPVVLPFELEQFRKKYDNDKRLFRDEFRQYQTVQGELDDTKEFPHTPFRLQQIHLKFGFPYSKDILEIFDNIQVTRRIPFATIRGYYKLHQDLVPPQDWAWDYQHIILVKLVQDLNSPSEYSNVRVYIQGGMCYVEVEVTKTPFESVDETKQRVTELLLEIVGKDVTFTTEEQIKIKGAVYFPGLSFRRSVFMDLLLTDPFFSFYFYTDDRLMKTRKRENIYLHYGDPQQGDLASKIACSISQKVSEGVIFREDPKLFPLNSFYVQIKIVHTKNTQQVDMLVSLMAKLWTHYAHREKELVNLYAPFISTNPKSPPKGAKPKREGRLKYIAPELFVSGYSRTCAHPPEIVTERPSNDDQQVMTFPKTTKEGMQRDYVCSVFPYVWPGLIPNKLANKREFPYLPCCYKTDQTIKQKSGYRAYYYSARGTEKQFEHTITTSKILKEAQKGELPGKDLKLLFPPSRFKRYGVFRGPNSLLESVWMATDPGFFISSSGERQRRIEEKRQEWSKDPRVAVCAQSFPRKNTAFIQSILANTSDYLDPRLFLSLLEHELDCKIYVISVDGPVYPHFEQVYLSVKPQGGSIFIFEHWGSEADIADVTRNYPQCEIIMDERENMVFSSEEPITQTVQTVFERSLVCYQGSSVVKVRDKFTFGVNDLVGQSFDSFGKCVSLFFAEKNNSIQMDLSQRRPPLFTERFEQQRPPRWGVLESFLRKSNVHLSEQFLDQGKTVRVCGRLPSGEQVSFPIEPTEPLNIPVTSKSFSVPSTTGLVDRYTFYSRISVYLFEYFVHMFSVFVNGRDKLESFIEPFVTDFISISNVEYSEMIPRYFSTNDSEFIKQNKLVLPSERMVNRFVYNLLNWIRVNPERVQAYRTFPFIQNYYLNVYCFKDHPEQLLLQGKESFEQLKRDSTESQGYAIVRSLADVKDTCFVDLPGLKEGVMLARRFLELQPALRVLFFHQSQKEHLDASYTPFTYTVHTPVSLTRFETHTIFHQNVFENPPALLIYKQDGAVYYTALFDV